MKEEQRYIAISPDEISVRVQGDGVVVIFGRKPTEQLPPVKDARIFLSLEGAFLFCEEVVNQLAALSEKKAKRLEKLKERIEAEREKEANQLEVEQTNDTT